MAAMFFGEQFMVDEKHDCAEQGRASPVIEAFADHLIGCLKMPIESQIFFVGGGCPRLQDTYGF